MKKLYSINQLSRLTNVSIRTLHHYDEINILKPSHRTSKGHRRYSEENLLQLQQIVMLKFLGFSLVEIKNILAQAYFNFFDSLKIQEKVLAEQMQRAQKISKLINYLNVQHELKQPINWEIVVQIFDVLKFNNIDHQHWYEKYLTDSEQQQFERHGLAHMGTWQALFAEAKDNLNSFPDDQRDILFAEKLLTIAKEYYGSEPDLINKLWEGFKAGIIPEQLANDKEIISYITRSVEKMMIS